MLDDARRALVLRLTQEQAVQVLSLQRMHEKQNSTVAALLMRLRQEQTVQMTSLRQDHEQQMSTMLRLINGGSEGITERDLKTLERVCMQKNPSLEVEPRQDETAMDHSSIGPGATGSALLLTAPTATNCATLLQSSNRGDGSFNGCGDHNMVTYHGHGCATGGGNSYGGSSSGGTSVCSTNAVGTMGDAIRVDVRSLCDNGGMSTFSGAHCLHGVSIDTISASGDTGSSACRVSSIRSGSNGDGGGRGGGDKGVGCGCVGSGGGGSEIVLSGNVNDSSYLNGTSVSSCCDNNVPGGSCFCGVAGNEESLDATRKRPSNKYVAGNAGSSEMCRGATAAKVAGSQKDRSSIASDVSAVPKPLSSNTFDILCNAAVYVSPYSANLAIDEESSSPMSKSQHSRRRRCARPAGGNSCELIDPAAKKVRGAAPTMGPALPLLNPSMPSVAH
mmetsp:Transcript_26365/g.43800  ORF Transcript_26365/g.43800 Transcript_26365/m.43800 type:complete len:446 (+) Transcript_26365:39-1376(+)